jgi:hypothetical protein
MRNTWIVCIVACRSISRRNRPEAVLAVMVRLWLSRRGRSRLKAWYRYIGVSNSLRVFAQNRKCAFLCSIVPLLMMNSLSLKEFFKSRGTIKQRKAHFLFWANTLRELSIPSFDARPPTSRQPYSHHHGLRPVPATKASASHNTKNRSNDQQTKW